MDKEYAYRPSGLGRVKLCPGSVALSEKLIREGVGKGTGSPEAMEGTMLHKCVEDNDIDRNLNEEQISAVQKCIDYKSDRVYQAYPNSDTFESHNEKSLHLWDGEEGFGHLLSGTIDFLAFEGDSGFIVDWKFGRLPLPEVSVSLQLACYSAMAMQRYDLKTVDAFVYMPRGGWEYHIRFDGGAEYIVENIIKPVIREAEEENAKRESSFEACHYCPAILHCPEAISNVAEVTKLDGGGPTIIDPETVDNNIEQIKIAEKVGAAYLKEAKAYYVDGGTSSRWGMISRKGSLKVDGGTNAIYDLVAGSLSREDFMSVCRVSLPKLRKLFTERSGKDKKTGEEELNTVIEPLTSRGKDVQVLQKKRDQTND